MIRRVSKACATDRFDSFLAKHNIPAGAFGVNRRLVGRAVLIGLFFALLPIPAQMFFVIAVAAFVRFNIPIALAAVWLSNPLTMPFIYYAQYEFGSWLLMQEAQVEMQLSVGWFREHYQSILLQLVVGSLATASLISLSTYTLVDRLWVRSVRRKHASRRKNL